MKINIEWPGNYNSFEDERRLTLVPYTSPSPKFKVGDKVRRFHDDVGIGVITEVCDRPYWHWPYRVEWPVGAVYEAEYDIGLVPDRRAFIADMITDTPPRVEIEYVIEEARKRVYVEDGEDDLVGYWTYPLQDTITERLADGWTLKQVLPYGNKGVKFMAVFEREVSDEDMSPFNDRPDAVGGR